MAEVTKTFKVSEEEDLKQILAAKKELDDLQMRVGVIVKQAHEESTALNHEYNRKMRALWDLIGRKFVPNHMVAWHTNKAGFDFRYLEEHGDVFVLYTYDAEELAGNMPNGNSPTTKIMQ